MRVVKIPSLDSDSSYLPNGLNRTLPCAPCPIAMLPVPSLVCHVHTGCPSTCATGWPCLYCVFLAPGSLESCPVTRSTVISCAALEMLHGAFWENFLQTPSESGMYLDMMPASQLWLCVSQMCLHNPAVVTDQGTEMLPLTCHVCPDNAQHGLNFK